MKKTYKNIIIVSAIITVISAVIFIACKKTTNEPETDDSMKKFEQLMQQGAAVHNEGLEYAYNELINPFDKHHEYLRKMFDDVIIFLSNTQNNLKYKDFELFMKDFDKIVAKYEKNYPYKHFDINEYDAKTQSIAQKIIENYIKNINNYGLSKATNQTEEQIAKLSNYNFQQSMYSLVSELKFTLSLLENIEDVFNTKRPNWEQRLVACMEKKADATFGNGSNWIDWVAFLWNPPGNLAWWVGSCSWSATFG
jgi:hypothetical protein